VNINLFVNYYEESNAKRRPELDMCMQKNATNPYLNFIPITSQNRMTFGDFFSICNSYSNEDDVSIVANLDIYFDETIRLAEKIKRNNFWALGRWDVKKDGTIVHACRPDSQDAWFVKGPFKNINANFEMGKCGCDNRLAHEAKKAGYKVENPSKSIKAMHVHTSAIRNYKRRKKQDLVPGPYYTVYPTEL